VEPGKPTKLHLAECGILPEAVNTLAAEICHIARGQALAVARDTLEYITPQNGPPKVYVPRSLAERL